MASSPASVVRGMLTSVGSGPSARLVISNWVGSTLPRAVARRTDSAIAAGSTFASVSSERFL